MNYAVGYTLGLKDMFCRFDISKLDLTAKKCEELIGNRHKERIAFKVFKYALKLILDDIIHNSITFILPLVNKEARIKMKRYENEDFIKGRKNGKWKNIDFLASNFTGY